MERVPVFFETLDQADPRLRVVQLVRMELFKRSPAPLPFANTAAELKAVLGALVRSGKNPALFVINTHGAEALLEELDDLMAELPALFYRRELDWLQKGGGDGAIGITDRIEMLRPRLSVIRRYGPMTASSIALHTARQIEEFLNTGEFRASEAKRRSERLAMSRGDSERFKA